MPVLLIGARRDTMDALIAQLRAMGVEARGSTNVEAATRELDAKDADLVVFGGGISHAVRERLASEFRAQNPNVRLLEAFAPVALTQIAAALHGGGAAKRASGFEVVRRNGSHVVRLDMREASDLRIQLYQSPVEGRTILDERVSAGPFELALEPVEEPRIVVVTLGTKFTCAALNPDAGGPLPNRDAERRPDRDSIRFTFRRCSC